MDKTARDLWAAIPSSGFSCKPGCSACCRTAVQMLGSEWEDLLHDPEVERRFVGLEGTIQVEEDQDGKVVRVVWVERGCCPLLDHTANRCSCYEKRPLVCRMYGRSWIMWCREGVKCAPEGEVPDAIVKEYGRLTGCKGAVLPPDALQRVKQAVEKWRDVEGQPDALPTLAHLAKYMAT